MNNFSAVCLILLGLVCIVAFTITCIIYYNEEVDSGQLLTRQAGELVTRYFYLLHLAG